MAGTNSELELVAEGPAIILVEPQLGENIGMVARAMANFGLSRAKTEPASAISTTTSRSERKGQGPAAQAAGFSCVSRGSRCSG